MPRTPELPLLESAAGLLLLPPGEVGKRNSPVCRALALPARSLKEVNLAYTPEAEIGKYVLVHVGFAISVIDEDEAQRVFKVLEEMGAVKEELGEIPQ